MRRVTSGSAHSALPSTTRGPAPPVHAVGYRVYMYGLACMPRMHATQLKCILIKSQFPWSDLSHDMQELIRDQTGTIFAVESNFTMHLRFPEVGWTNVPYVIRYELLLTPRDLSTSPEIKVTLTRFLNPAFKHSRLFRESDASMQELLVNNFKEITFSSISAVRLEMRHDCAGQFEFIQFVSRKHGVEHAFRTPFWSRIERNTIEEVREKFESMFYMEFD